VHEALAEVIAGRLTRLEGIVRTRTMVAFEAFSRHDLESMFSIGQ
jgi:hypothetical protein